MSPACPACGGALCPPFHRSEGVPTNSCLLLETREEAVGFPTGRLELALCPSCGFITNTAFDPARAEYSGRYEETQGFSPRFVDFGRSLAKEWVDRYHLHGRSVLEIGCGKGEFLAWMVEAGAGAGIGIDPGVHPERLDGVAARAIEWIADFYDERYAHLQADAVVCRHTLEHIGPVGQFMQRLRANLGDRTDVPVLFELPDTQRVLDEVAFWDTYYEHCSYFTAGSLARLFERTGFEVRDVRLAYEGQYLLLEAVPAAGTPPAAPVADDRAAVAAGVADFHQGFARTVAHWRERVTSARGGGHDVVVWGGGSKAVAFLTSLGVGGQIAGAVDINPHKQGRFIAGSGHRVLAPSELVGLRPGLVVAMNPVYLDEIRSDLDRLGLRDTELTAV